MQIGKVAAAFAVLISLLLYLSACSNSTPFRFAVENQSADLSGFSLSFRATKPVVSVELLDANGGLLQVQPVPRLQSGQINVPFPPVYSGLLLRAVSESGEADSLPLEFTDRDTEPIVLRSPLLPHSLEPLVATPDSEMLLFLELNGVPGESYSFTAELRADQPLTLHSEGRQPSPDGSIQISGETAAFVRTITRNVVLRIPAAVDPGEYRVSASINLNAGAANRAPTQFLSVLVLPVDRLQDAVEIAGVEMPTTSDGRLQEGYKRDFIPLRSGTGKAPAGLLPPFSAPSAFQTVTLVNRLDKDLPVILSTHVTSAGGERVEFLHRPSSIAGSGDRIVTMLQAGSASRITVPIFVDHDTALPGNYTRDISVNLAGNGILLAGERRPLQLSRTPDLALMVTALAVLLTVATFGYAAFRGSSFLARFTTRQIILLALVAAASVVLVNLPVFFLASITFSLLGPLGFLVDALLTEFLYGALLVALISIVPRQGVCSLVAGIRFLLGGVLLGMITPVGALHTAVSALALETAVWLSGVARRGRRRAVNIRLLLLFGTANALISWVGFQLSIILFRLHYADWYVALSVVVGGFVYSLAGAAVGRSVGRQLAQTAA